MKNILMKILLVIFLLSFSWIYNISNTYAAGSWSWITVIVSEKIPGAWCEDWDKDKNNIVINYKCTIKPWFWTVIIMLWNIIKYFTFIAALGWVLFIVVNWILYSMWWADPSLKDEAKKRIVWTLVWLILLFLSWVILNLIAPWIYK